jgi:hypothetical protein
MVMITYQEHNLNICCDIFVNIMNIGSLLTLLIKMMTSKSVYKSSIKLFQQFRNGGLKLQMLMQALNKLTKMERVQYLFYNFAIGQ